jgi:hypothetical protein
MTGQQIAAVIADAFEKDLATPEAVAAELDKTENGRLLLCMPLTDVLAKLTLADLLQIATQAKS